MDLTQRFAGKSCLVTGSGGSIGRAICSRLAAEGASVIGCDVNAESAGETRRLVAEAGGEMVSIHPTDLTKEEDCERVVAEAVDAFGKIDVLINNGAMAYFAWIQDMSNDLWSKTINQELDLVFLMTRAAWAELIKTGGSIVNIASASAWVGIELLPGLAHTAAKGGVLAMTRHLAMEGRSHGIRANTVSPGTVETNQTRFILEDPNWSRIQLSRAMMNRMAQPSEIASAVAFLASDDASYVTGADLAVDGGLRAW